MAAALLGLLAALLLVPGLPAWARLARYALGYGAVLLLAREAWRSGPAWAERWRAAGRFRWAAGAAAIAATVLVMLALREAAPGFYGRAAQEYGLWEPLSFLCYLGGATLLVRVTRRLPALERRRWTVVIGVFAVLALEEIDWFGIFGGIIGRIEGVYTGSLHDVVMLVAEDILGPTGLALVAVVLLVALLFLWRTGWFDPGFLARLALRPASLWPLAGILLLAVAAAEEAHLFGWVAAEPTPEEAVELAGALCFGIWALELAGGIGAERQSRGGSA